MAQFPSAVDDPIEGIAWLHSRLVLKKLLRNGLLQVPMQLVPGPNALMCGERRELGVGRQRGLPLDT